MKKPLKSKTIIFNMVMGAIDVIVINIQLLEQFMSVKEFAVVFLVLTSIHKVGNIYLRFLTKEALDVN